MADTTTATDTPVRRKTRATQRGRQLAERGQQLARYSSELEQQLAQANDMLRQLRRPAPIQRQGKVVSLPQAARQDSGEA